jgi:hypothetical protein
MLWAWIAIFSNPMLFAGENQNNERGHLMRGVSCGKNWEIREGRFYVEGKPVFLKIGTPLRDFGKAEECEELIQALDLLKEKHYNALKINCYWHQFDFTGDGSIDATMEPLIRLLDTMEEKNIFPILSIETYGVGGGFLPEGFWQKNPDAVAINSKGEEVRDTEYGFLAAVPSLHSPDYQKAARRFIKDLTSRIRPERIVYFETTVEPQFIGNQWIDFSPHGKRDYEAWLEETGVDGPAWPESFPVSEEFLQDENWLRFRAEFLAGWVCDDAAAFRAAAGPDAVIAVDYLETCGDEMPKRNGDSLIFLRNLDCANIIQVNWHWNNETRKPNQCAYDNVRQVMKETGRPWVIMEHMTINGSDYDPKEIPALIENTLKQGTLFGWEYPTVTPSSGDAFSLYNDDWSPKPPIAVFDQRWDEWLELVERYAKER